MEGRRAQTQSQKVATAKEGRSFTVGDLLTLCWMGDRNEWGFRSFVFPLETVVSEQLSLGALCGANV